MKPREYCCCAIPIIYAGIYTALTEQFVLGILAGTLSVATPHIVGAATGSYASWIFAIICFVGAAFKYWERPIMFRRYTTLHLLVTLGAFSVSAVWIIMSATRHSVAKSQCESDFFSQSDSITASEGGVLCNIFPWVDVGIMAGLWVLLAIVQLYLYVILSSYSSGQERDHEKYDSLYDQTRPLANDIPLSHRTNAWDRPSMDDVGVRPYHDRSGSVGSVSTVVADKVQQPAQYEQYGQSAYPPPPGHAYLQDGAPTPDARDNYYNTGYDGGVGYPERTQTHPAEGSFRRKMPRLQKPQSEDYDIYNYNR
ncbi:hypothetical protein B0H21DRAFT_723506 [Amylocystis lapponica]|nr:hypothetical protein B0H21DRAFT_723506 [Amylocystis lapponica]